MDDLVPPPEEGGAAPNLRSKITKWDVPYRDSEFATFRFYLKNLFGGGPNYDKEVHRVHKVLEKKHNVIVPSKLDNRGTPEHMVLFINFSMCY